VIDASAALVLASSHRSFDDHEFESPTLLMSETTSVLHEAVWRGDLGPDVADVHGKRLAALRVRLHPSSGLLAAAWELAERLGWAKTYDAEYVALADRLRLPLLTVDARLARRVRGVVDLAAPADLIQG
jgi:predicted nucleic acid-binding protein